MIFLCGAGTARTFGHNVRMEERLIGVLTLLGGSALAAAIGLYLHRPASMRRPPQPTFREDVKSAWNWVRGKP
ncbi:MAG: hypothetical protein DLM59_17915 [Pseudonocardiales bacterium]|nr:MAG: hypothetical protein DLM59_17915 [Pseudonocardiales bacterium]